MINIINDPVLKKTTQDILYTSKKEKLFESLMGFFRNQDNLEERIAINKLDESSKDYSKKYYEIIKNGKEQKAGKKGEYTFIPLHSNAVECVMRLIELLVFSGIHKYHLERKKYYFYDMGSGIGNILFAAYYYLNIPIENLIGVENKFNIKTGYIIAPKIEKNFFKLTKKEIKSNSIIYMYNPLCDVKKMQLFCDHLMNISPVETVIVYYKVSGASFKYSPGFKEREGTLHMIENIEILKLTK